MSSIKNITLSSSVAIFFILVTTAITQPVESFVQRAIQDTSFHWRSVSSDRIRVFYQENSFAERHRMMLFRSARTAVDEVLTNLNETSNGRILNIFYLESRDEMARIVGHTYSGFADWTGNGIFLVLNSEWRSFEKHEFAHIVTMGGWGSPHPTSQWMIEGIAIYCDGWCRLYTVDEIALHFLINGQLPTPQELVTDFRSLGEIRAGISAASFIGFIHHSYGIPKVRQLWLNGVEDLEEQLDDDLEKIKNSWILYLQNKMRNNTDVDMNGIQERGCG